MNRRQSILIVEDVASDIDLLNHILKNHYTVYIAKTGKAALENAIERKPDLILLDLILPDMTGFAVLTTLKETSETRDIPVIIITGINNVQYEEKGLMIGAVDYITKPFHNTVVLARIKMHLQLLRYIQTISRLGLIDALTDLPNHRGFENQLGVEWARSIREKTPLSLLIVDIDGFGTVNEKYGRLQGDFVLQKIAAEIGVAFHRPADLVARLENDQFAVLLPNTDPNGAGVVAEDVRVHVEKTSICLVDNADESLSVTVGIGGVSKSPLITDSLDDFLSEAKQCVKQAGEQGGNRVIFDDDGN